jgi:hypothetical protein
MTQTESKPNLPKPFCAIAHQTELAQLETTAESWGEPATDFILHAFGQEVKNEGCLVEVVHGPDAGKKFIANVGIGRRFEPLSITLIAAIAEE